MKLNNFLKSGIATILILVVGLVLMLTVGFNKSFDYTGGTILTVNTTDYEVSESYNKVYKVLGENNIVVSSIGQGENDVGTCLIIKYQIAEDKLAINDKVFEDIFVIFGYDKADAVESSYVTMNTQTTPAYSSIVMSNALLASIITLVGVAIYLFFRHNFVTGFAMIAGGAISIGLMLALTAILRLPINSAMGTAIIATLIVSMIMHYMVLSKMNNLAVDPSVGKVSNSEIADMAIKVERNKLVLISVSAVIALLIIAFAGGGAMWATVLSIILGIISAFFLSIFALPTLWAIAFVRKNPKIKQKQAVVVEQYEAKAEETEEVEEPAEEKVVEENK